MQSKILKLIERGGHTKRFHGLPTLHEETVGHHSYLVAWLCWTMSGKQPSTQLLMAALQHDVAEYLTGDMPSPTKLALNKDGAFTDYERRVLWDHHHSDLSEQLSEQEQHVLALADTAAGMLKCLHERKLGNLYLVQTFHRYKSYAVRIGLQTDLERELFNDIEVEWRLTHGSE